MISYTFEFHSQKFQKSCIPGKSCFKFQMKCLNCRNFVTARAFVTGCHLFTFLIVLPILCAPLVILDFCLVASNTVIWASLFGAHRFKLEIKDFIFHVVVFSREGFQNLAWKFLLYVLQKVSWVYVFLNSVLMQYIIVQKLGKTCPRRLYTFCLILFSDGM